MNFLPPDLKVAQRWARIFQHDRSLRAELVSDACWRILKMKASPLDDAHRHRLIRLAVKQANVDLLRRQPGRESRRSIEKRKAGLPLSRTIKRNAYTLVSADAIAHFYARYPDPSTLERGELANRLEALHSAMESLRRTDPRAAQMVEQYHLGGRTLKQVAKLHGVSEARISQIVIKSLEYLRRRVRVIMKNRA